MDRLSELKEHHVSVLIETPAIVVDNYRPDFNKIINDIKDTIENKLKLLNLRNTTMAIIQEKIYKCVSHDEITANESKINTLTNEFYVLSKSVRKDIDGIKTNKSINEHPDLVMDLTSRYLQLYSDLGKEHMALLDIYKNSKKSIYKRQLTIISNNRLTEEEIDKHVEDGTAHEYFKQALSSDDTMIEVEDIESRHRDILQLEKTTLEVAELFKDLAMLVDSQQDIINNIDIRISKTKDNTNKGKDNLVIAKEYQQSSRCSGCCIAAIVIGIIAVLIISIVTPYFIKNNS